MPYAINVGTVFRPANSVFSDSLIKEEARTQVLQSITFELPQRSHEKSLNEESPKIKKRLKVVPIGRRAHRT